MPSHLLQSQLQKQHDTDTLIYITDREKHEDNKQGQFREKHGGRTTPSTSHSKEKHTDNKDKKHNTNKQYGIRSRYSWRWYINTIINFLDIIHRSLFI
jgi:hypothetical protein